VSLTVTSHVTHFPSFHGSQCYTIRSLLISSKQASRLPLTPGCPPSPLLATPGRSGLEALQSESCHPLNNRPACCPLPHAVFTRMGITVTLFCQQQVYIGHVGGTPRCGSVKSYINLCMTINCRAWNYSTSRTIYSS